MKIDVVVERSSQRLNLILLCLGEENPALARAEGVRHRQRGGARQAHRAELKGSSSVEQGSAKRFFPGCVNFLLCVDWVVHTKTATPFGRSLYNSWVFELSSL